MFTSKVYTVSIPSSSVVLEEERIARDVINKWNVENGERTGFVLLPIPSDCKDVTPDIYIFTIDNYVELAKIEAAVATGAKVFLFFRRHHDPNNTIQMELDKILAIRKSVQHICTCVDYDGTVNFRMALLNELEIFGNQ